VAVKRLFEVMNQCKAVVTTTVESPFDSHSTAVPPRCHHTTTYVTTALLHRVVNK